MAEGHRHTHIVRRGDMWRCLACNKQWSNDDDAPVCTPPEDVAPSRPRPPQQPAPKHKRRRRVRNPFY